jgi:hypothetical protein
MVILSGRKYAIVFSDDLILNEKKPPRAYAPAAIQKTK